MEKLIFVRYGEYDETGHISEVGKRNIFALAERLKPITSGSVVHVAAAAIARATESAQLLAEKIGAEYTGSFSEFYAADEDGLLPNAERANRRITEFGTSCDVLIVVASREYIDVLPGHIFPALHLDRMLNRGEGLVMHYASQTVTYV